MDGLADFIIPNILSFLPDVGDLNNDGETDIALSVDLNDSGVVNIYNIGENRDTIPDFVISDTATAFGNNVAIGKFNADNYPDLAVAAYLNRDSCFVKFYWGGPEFDTIADFEIHNFSVNFGRILLPIDDFNGDGYGDIFIAGADDQNPFGVYFGGPDIDGDIDLILNISPSGFGYYPPNSADIAGDLNNDGFLDLILGFSAHLIYLHEISIFLGGPDVDTIPDVYIENQHMPESQIDFGDEVAIIGDFNGDGIDDFAVRSRTSGSLHYWRGEVNVFAGWDSQPNDVEYEYSPALPKEFRLHQNYPNPFNPSTLIKFELPYRDHVRLSVFDLLGRKIITLLNEGLPAGLYEVAWDGTDIQGAFLPSGVYFYRLELSDYTETRKMVLIR
jgi:hypothetical protein